MKLILCVAAACVALQDVAPPKKRRIFADLPADGTLALAGEAVPWKELAPSLKRLAADGVREIALRADGAVPFSSVQSLMSAARDAGIESVQFSSDAPVAPAKFAEESRKSLRIKLREGPKGLEIVVLQETTVASADALRRLLKGAEKTPVVIDADVEVPYGAVKEVIGACTDEGFEKISFAAPPRKEGAVRVLLVEHAPRYEFRYLRNFLERSADFKVDAVLATADPAFPGALAAVPADLSAYDVVVLGEIRSIAADAKKALVERVKSGGGVVWRAPAAPPSEWLGHELDGICPVKLSPKAQGGGIPLAPLALEAKDAKHPLVAGLKWDEMSGKLRAEWGVEAVDADASVLAEFRWGIREDRHPFLAVQTAGRGRAAFVGSPDTWPWRAGTGDAPHFGPFWTRLLKWAAGR